MKKSILILIFCFSITFNYAQVNSFTRQIFWVKTCPFLDGTYTNRNGNQFFNFEYATFPDLNTKLPFYSENLELTKEFDNVSKLNVSIKIKEQIELSVNEVQSYYGQSFVKEEIDISQNIISTGGKNFAQISFVPILKTKENKVFLIKSFELIICGIEINKQKAVISYKSNSVLSSGKWVKIKVEKDGIYQLTYSELQQMGFSDPTKVRIFGNSFGILSESNATYRPDDLLELKIKNQNNSILFYAKGADRWEYKSTTNMFELTKHYYSRYSYYFITDYNTGFDNSIETIQQSTESSTITVNSFDDYYHHENDDINLIKSGREWYGERFDLINSYDFNFEFKNKAANSPLKIKYSLLNQSSDSAKYLISTSESSQYIKLGPSGSSNTEPVASEAKGNITYTTGTNDLITINLKYLKKNINSVGWMNYLTVNCRRNLVFVSGQMHFRDRQSVNSGGIAEYVVSNCTNNTILWDITNPVLPQQISANLSNNELRFKIENSEPHDFIAFDNTFFLKPIVTGSDVGAIENQNLHAIPGNTHFIILTNKKFLNAANDLATYRQAKNSINTVVVTNEQVYNEFSSGIPDVTAIRDFARMVYSRKTGTDSLKYLLLFGDASYDNLTNSATNTNYTLSYQSVNSLNQGASYITDDYFGFLDANETSTYGLLDIGIGRIPVGSETEAQNFVDKIKRYENPASFGDWRNMLCFIGDDGDFSMHMNQADYLANMVEKTAPQYNLDKIYLDSYQQISSSLGQRYPDVEKAIVNRINKGALIVNYTGHAGEFSWTNENILNLHQVDDWTNKFYPMFMTATCEFSRFDNYDGMSGGEYILLRPSTGSIAMFSTTRLVYASPNFTLNKRFYNYVFSKNSGSYLSLGDIMRLTKNSAGFDDNKLSFTLLGDPSMKLAYPENYAQVTNINNHSTDSYIDTLKALNKIKINGIIKDSQNNKISTYNGIVTVTIYDKKKRINTLNNDNEGVFEYYNQNNILYNGKSSVINGDFELSFYVPKDIALNIDTGKISIYAQSSNSDAAGVSKKLLIGGISSNPYYDKDGPEIRLYINDSAFVEGGITNSNPKLVAFVADSSGINTVGTGIGHDITAVLDNDRNSVYTLNDSYTAEINNFKKGKIAYQFNQLTEGKHSIKLKVWDIFNNSSEKEIEFTVIDKNNFTINKLYNYPNPLRDFTQFCFEHNQSDTELNIVIQIFSMSGRLVKTIEANVVSDGYRVNGIEWDGTSDYGSNLEQGIYIYRVKVKNQENQIVEKQEKLLLLK